MGRASPCRAPRPSPARSAIRQAPVDDLLAFHVVFGKTVADVSLNAVANLGYAACRFLAAGLSRRHAVGDLRGDRPQGEFQPPERPRLCPLARLQPTRPADARLRALGDGAQARPAGCGAAATMSPICPRRRAGQARRRLPDDRRGRLRFRARRLALSLGRLRAGRTHRPRRRRHGRRSRAPDRDAPLPERRQGALQPVQRKPGPVRPAADLRRPRHLARPRAVLQRPRQRLPRRGDQRRPARRAAVRRRHGVRLERSHRKRGIARPRRRRRAAAAHGRRPRTARAAISRCARAKATSRASSSTSTTGRCCRARGDRDAPAERRRADPRRSATGDRRRALGPAQQPGAERTIAALLAAWREEGLPIVHIRHDSVEPDSPYRPDRPSHAFKPETAPRPGEAVVAKTAHSAFVGAALEETLDGVGATTLVICGALTHNSVEATARHAADLGYRVFVVADACWAVALADGAGGFWPAEIVHRVALACLAGEYAAVVDARNDVGGGAARQDAAAVEGDLRRGRRLSGTRGRCGSSGACSRGSAGANSPLGLRRVRGGALATSRPPSPAAIPLRRAMDRPTASSPAGRAETQDRSLSPSARLRPGRLDAPTERRRGLRRVHPRRASTSRSNCRRQATGRASRQAGFAARASSRACNAATSASASARF